MNIDFKLWKDFLVEKEHRHLFQEEKSFRREMRVGERESFVSWLVILLR